jgi:hypothetical protein
LGLSPREAPSAIVHSKEREEEKKKRKRKRETEERGIELTLLRSSPHTQ